MRQFRINIVLGFILIFSTRCDTTLFFPTNSAYGIFAAIAVPLDLPHRNVFVSYNFEANYNMLVKPALPPILNGYAREATDEELCTNCTLSEHVTVTSTTTTEKEEEEVTNAEESNEDEHSRTTRSLLTRTHFYHILRDKFERSGYRGESCLLRLICEVNATELGDINGVLGSLVHILFSPSTSGYERLPLAYYQAELDGQHEQCHHYSNECPESILALISTPVQQIIEQLTNTI